MNFAAVISWLLWRFAPVQWLERTVGRLIAWALELLEDERAWLDEHPRNAQWLVYPEEPPQAASRRGWLAIIEARIEELIEARAYQLLGRPWPGRDVPAHLPLYSVRSASHCVERFLALIERFAAAERLARCRAEKLARLFEQTPFDFAGSTLAGVRRSGRQFMPPPPSAAFFASPPAAAIFLDRRIRAPP